MENDRVLGIFKFGKRCNIDQFAQGLLYMSTLGHFVKVETNAVRADPHEGTSYLIQRLRGARLHVQIDGEYKPIATIGGPVRHQETGALNANVFCMYALHASVTETLIDPRNFEFGDAFAVVVQFDEFMRRVKEAVLNSGHELQYGLVTYIDEESYEGPMGPFKIGSGFSYQSEWRLALLPGTGEPYRLQVGDLSDIVIVGDPLAEINEGLRIVPGDSQERTAASA